MGKGQAHLTVALVLGASAFCCGPDAVADIFKYVDKHGRVFLTDRPDRPGYKLLVRTWKGWSESSFTHSAKYRAAYNALIARAATTYRLPNALLHAVITAESSYNANAISRAGAVGLMQLMPDTARRYGVSNRTDPRANILGGSRYLRDLLGMFNNNLVLALAAYNAGENAVIRHGKKIPPYPETQTYVKRVLEYYKRYRLTM
jgi:soluble lytic murein transglycosylase-like protein